MAINDNQGDEPRTTAFERQVQTLAVAVERLTKQNHLEEQFRQRNVRPNNHEEEQEGTSPQHTTKWRDREGLKDNNTLSRQER